MARSPIETRMIEAIGDGAEAAGVHLCDCSETCRGVSLKAASSEASSRIQIAFSEQAPWGYERGLCDGPHVELFSSVSVLSYRLDLLLVCDGGSPMLAIECDGFDYHERTKQQAAYDRARDRELLRLGIPTIRFLGSEIYHYPERCAAEAFETILALAGREYGNHRTGFDAGRERGLEEGARKAAEAEQARGIRSEDLTGRDLDVLGLGFTRGVRHACEAFSVEFNDLHQEEHW